MADGAGFEPAEVLSPPVFEAGAFGQAQPTVQGVCLSLHIFRQNDTPTTRKHRPTKMAETAGFEPAGGVTPTRFPGGHLKPGSVTSPSHCGGARGIRTHGPFLGANRFQGGRVQPDSASAPQCYYGAPEESRTLTPHGPPCLRRLRLPFRHGGKNLWCSRQELNLHGVSPDAF